MTKQGVVPEKEYPDGWPACTCGCGEPVPAATYTCEKRGLVKGQPRRFIQGHNSTSLDPAYVVDAAGCWLWQRSLVPGGYGRIEKADGTRLRAHRVYYEKHVGPIPEGHEVHHACRNRSCVNPAHLEALSKSDHRVRHGKSRYLGVVFNIEKGAWMARIRRNGQRQYLRGKFETEAAAAAAIEEAGGYAG